MHEARARARLDGVERLREVEPAALGEHERLAAGDEMDEGQHVGDDLDDARLAELAHVEDLAAHGFERGPMRLEHGLFAADQDRDLALRREVHPARHRTLEGRHALPGGERRDALDLALIGGAHLDPGAAAAQTLQHAVRPRQHGVRRRRRRQAGDHAVDLLGERPRRIRPDAARVEQRLRRIAVQVVHHHLETGATQARREMFAEIAEADVPVLHLVTPGLRCGTPLGRATAG